MWAGVLSALGPPGAIQQKALDRLEVLRGWHDIGGWLPMGMEPKDWGKALGRDTGSVCLGFQADMSNLSIPLACPVHFYFLPRMKTNIYL